MKDTIYLYIKSVIIGVTTPMGIRLQIGQRWQEVDSRFTRYVTVIGFDFTKKKVHIKHGRKTWAKLERFNGKAHGYIFVDEPK